VKRSGRDESMRATIHKHMEAMLGVSLYSYLYPKLGKRLCLITSYVFSSAKLEIKREEQAGVGGGGPNNVYTCE
jgi:hypothetical protein